MNKFFALCALASCTASAALFAPKIIVATGSDISQYVDDITQLCLEVFREYPDLYAGTPEEYVPYIAQYAQSPEGIACLFYDKNTLVGVVTGAPIAAKGDKFHTPFGFSTDALARAFYIGELVLRIEYRGRGYGTLLYTRIEQWVKNLAQFDTIALYITQGEKDHPLRPVNYISADRFWAKQGFERHDQCKLVVPWRSVETSEDVVHTLVGWIKKIGQ